MDSYSRIKALDGGDMNEERVLELPTGEQLHCLSYHGSLDEFVELYREYAKANNLILAKLENGKARILEGKTTQPEYDLSQCRAYSTDLPKGQVDPMKQALDYFGRQLVAEVRDLAFAEAHKHVETGAKSRRNRPLAKALSKLDPDDIEAIKWLIRANVDSTMHYLLKLLEDDDRIKIAVKVSEDQEVDDLAHDTARSLFDEYFKGGSGWAAKYSKFGVDW